MRTLLIDNHDSYTFNLFQLIAEVNGLEPVVVKNNDTLLTSSYFGGFDNIVISPGPGRPQKREDLGHVAEVLARTHLPVLGVCLGHQAIAHLAGAQVGLAPQPRHGYLSRITHDGRELFTGVPQEFTAVRYHSLCVEEPLPPELQATAWAEDGVVMGLRHRELPRWGVQFHPESIASEHGRLLLANFRDLTGEAGSATPAITAAPAPTPDLRLPTSNREDEPACHLETAVLPFAVPTDIAFSELFGSSSSSFWLDSSRVEQGLSRFSFMGDADGPLSETLTYKAGSKVVTVRDASGLRVESGDIFEVLDRRLAERRVDARNLPFDFTGGYVGYFGYEIKADCGGSQVHRSETPDATWIFADRLIAVDHQEDVTYLLTVHQDDEDSALHAKQWLDTITSRLLIVQEQSARQRTKAAGTQPPAQSAEPYLVLDASGYQGSIDECRRQLVRGESYEICLTNKAHLPFDDDDLPFYLRLRQVNPAPYAALFRNGPTTIYCSSPERFLRIDRDGWAESKPIKGTAPRDSDPERDAQLAAELASNDKTRAENLMIVDLLRNDLGQVCEIGTVTVDRFMAVESYATVHQLVSTIRGRLNPRCTPVASVRHCFPGGSMTGAPKKRTMEIIDRLETEARGIYSGSLGYFGLSGGADLNIVIRTAVRHGDRLSIGAGGAIVLDSGPEEEYQEMLLKAAAPLRAWRPTA